MHGAGVRPIQFDHTDGAITLQWQEQGSRVGYIRTHKDESAMPGPTEYTLAVEVYADGTYEFKLLAASKGGRGPTGEELERFNAYMESIGYRPAPWRRCKKGRIKQVTMNAKLPKN